jgi:hypothetical protein
MHIDHASGRMFAGVRSTSVRITPGVHIYDSLSIPGPPPPPPSTSASASTSGQRIITTQPTHRIECRGIIDRSGGLAINSKGNLLVVEWSHNKVLEFDLHQSLGESKQCTVVHSFGSAGSNDGEFFLPLGITTVASSQHIVVCDQFNDRIQIFTPSGEHAKTIDGFSKPCNVVADCFDNIYVSQSNTTDCIQVIALQFDSDDSKSVSYHRVLSGPGPTVLTHRMYKSMAISADRLYVILTCEKGMIHVYSVVQRKIIATHSLTKQPLAIALTNNGEIIYSCIGGNECILVRVSGFK